MDLWAGKCLATSLQDKSLGRSWFAALVDIHEGSTLVVADKVTNTTR